MTNVLDHAENHSMQLWIPEDLLKLMEFQKLPKQVCQQQVVLHQSLKNLQKYCQLLVMSFKYLMQELQFTGMYTIAHAMCIKCCHHKSMILIG